MGLLSRTLKAPLDNKERNAFMTRKIGKYFALFLAVCLLASALVACDSSSKDPEYTFRVVLGDTSQPAVGVQVQLCKGDDFCMMPVGTDSEGKAVYALGENGYDVYDVHIIEGSLPEGYTFDNTSVKTSVKTHEYTLTLIKDSQASSGGADCVHNYVGEVCTKCGAAKQYSYMVKVAYDASLSDADLAGKPLGDVSILITDGISMIAQGMTDDDGNFSFTAPKSSVVDGYTVLISNGIPEGYYTLKDLTFLLNSTVCNVDVYKTVVLDPYTAFNPADIPLGETVHVTMPERRYDDYGTLFSTSHDDSLYYFSFQPTKPEDVGYYRISITNSPADVIMLIGHHPSSANYTAFNADISATAHDPYIEFMVREEYLKDSTGAWTYNNSWIFGVRVDGDAEFPVSFDIKVERVRDLIVGKDYPIKSTQEIQIAAGAEKAEDIIGDVSGKTLKDIDITLGQSIVLVKDSNGYYHLNSVDGPLVMIKLSVQSRFFEGGEKEVVSFMNVNALSGVENLSLSFSENIDGKDYIITKYYKTMISQYSELCYDGAYVLNEQLYEFITEWVRQKRPSSVNGALLNDEATKDIAFLYGCSYYQ